LHPPRTVQTDDAPERADASDAPAHGGLVESVRHFVVNLLAHLRTRLALLGVEWAEERLRLAKALALGVAGMFLAALAVVLGLVFVIALAWNTPWRMPVIALLFGVALVVGVFLLALARHRLTDGANLFRNSLAELTRDQQRIDRLPAR